MGFRVYFDLYYSSEAIRTGTEERWQRQMRANTKGREDKMMLMQRVTMATHQFAGISRCMDQAELVERQQGELFNTVVRLRDDGYALDEWSLSADYSKG
eukprot:CAMPEP_0174259202 /NCGR_PEP_ID=MMETSP0439-20130205/8062_1 /TAXON_ID=0 /ORGANISM="Stereomyxa ramosa, Strain Chinc5" /LENGTH=98 /DNA_ID=CAMNT_0015342997 /DNA_START=235 /DNA_END=531 /DNA_ORIENTATION=+